MLAMITYRRFAPFVLEKLALRPEISTCDLMAALKKELQANVSTAGLMGKLGRMQESGLIQLGMRSAPALMRYTKAQQWVCHAIVTEKGLKEWNRIRPVSGRVCVSLIVKMPQYA